MRKSCDFSVEQEERDVAENILLLRLKKKGSNFQFIDGAIYGPNGYEPRFFEDIRRFLAATGDYPVILVVTGTAATAAPTGMLILIFLI